MSPFEFGNFDVCRLMADKATYDLDYKAQLERSACGHNQPIELAELNTEIEKSMVVFRMRHIRDKIVAWKRHSAWADSDDEFFEKAFEIVWEKGDELGFKRTTSCSARRALAMLAADQRIQSDPHPFQFTKLPPEIREQVYRELFIGGGRTIVVSKHSKPSSWSRSCQIEGRDVHEKDITTALLCTNRSIYNEALPLLYRSHAFDFGIDVHNIALFFSQTSFAARQNVGGIHMELLRYGIAHPLRSVSREEITKDNGLAWSSACAYIASHLLVKELSINIDFAIHQDFQRFRWVVDLAQIRGLRRIFHHDSPNKHGLKPAGTPKLLADQMSRNDWGTDQYRWEALLKYLRSKMLH